MNRYRNPWFKSCNTPRPEFYENTAKQVLIYRGVRVYKLFERGYDFVLGDCCITQRAGVTEAKREIDKILDGQTPVSQPVYDFLKSSGYAPMSYSG